MLGNKVEWRLASIHKNRLQLWTNLHAAPVHGSCISMKNNSFKYWGGALFLYVSGSTLVENHFVEICKPIIRTQLSVSYNSYLVLCNQVK